MYITTTNNPEPHNPIGSQYPLRPAARTSPIRINVKRSLKLHKVAAIVVILLVLGLGLAVVARHKPYYAASSIIYVSPTAPKTLVSDPELDRPYESYIQETMRDVTRYEVLAEAIRRMPPGLWLGPGESERSGVERLEKSMEVSRVGGTYQVQIELDGYRPERLAEIVNIVTAVFLEKAKGEELYGLGDRLQTLKDERTRIQKDIDSDLAEQAKITNSLGVAAFDAKGANILDVDNAKLHTDLSVAHEQRIQAEAQLAALNGGDPNAPNSALNAAADEAIAGDPALATLKNALSQKRADIINKLSGMTAINPDRKQAESQLLQIEKELSDMHAQLLRTAAARLEQKYRTQLNQAQMVESRLNGDLQRGTKLADDAAPKIQRAQEIDADLLTLHTRYVAVAERLSNLELESSSPGSVHLFSPAMAPLSPEKSKIGMLLVLIFPFSIFLGVLTAVLLDFIDPHVYNGSDVEAVLGFAPIGMLFDDREVTQIAFDECALRLAAGIDHASRAAGARTFVITAVNSGAGTTSIIESMGSMLAKLGRKTLVIDPSGNNEPIAFVTLGSDLMKRSIDLPGDTPLHSSVNTDLDTIRSIQRSIAPRVSAPSSFVFESFQSLSVDYDIVLFDAAPVLISAETEYLARMADVTVLVAEAGKTKKAWITRAARLLERMGVSGAAAIVNKVHPDRAEEALVHDLREFELRSDRVNLQDWWKPSRKSGRSSESAADSSDSFRRTASRAHQEDEVFAQEI